MPSPTLKHKRMAYYVVSVDGRSQIWKIDNAAGIGKYCRDVYAWESPADYQRYRPATPEEHDEIIAAIAKAKALGTC